MQKEKFCYEILLCRNVSVFENTIFMKGSKVEKLKKN